jgi:hypothetical protein
VGREVLDARSADAYSWLANEAVIVCTMSVE